MVEKNSSGQSIDSYCGKCRLNLDHTIMAMEGGVITRVRCKSCGSSHKFRSPLDVQKARKPKVKNNVGEAATAEIVWAANLAEAKGRERDYSMSSKYRIGDVVNHQTFGKGIVMKLYPNKCEMLFKDRERLMVQATESRD
jgi:hypothetical protein